MFHARCRIARHDLQVICGRSPTNMPRENETESRAAGVLFLSMTHVRTARVVKVPVPIQA
jgi:hypothetical protein